MKYRAVIQYTNGASGKPYQSFGERLDLLKEWCRIRVRKEVDGTPQPDGTEAVIYESIEKPVFRAVKSSDLTNEPVITESQQ